MFRFANMLVLKVTRDCNLRCSYCYIKNKDDFKGEIIDFELYKKVINRVVEDKRTLLKTDRDPTFNLIFHGGEPTLAKYDLFAKMLEYAKTNFNQYGIKHNFGIQTNMTLLNDDLLNLFHKYNVGIGASFDGIKKGNEGRTKIISEKSFLNKIEKVHSCNVSIGFLLVASKANIDTAIESKKFMKENLGSKGVKINYAEDVNTDSINSDNEVGGQEYYDKVIEPIIMNFIETGELEEENLEVIIRKFLTENLSEDRSKSIYNCNGKVCGGGINIVELNPDGRLYYCGRYSEDFDEAYVMDLDDSNFLALKQIKRYSDFIVHKHKALLEAGCDTCYADGICDHGCMAFHYSKFGKYGIRTDLVCPIYKSLYKFLSKYQLELVEALEKKYTFPYGMYSSHKISTLNKSSKLLYDLEEKKNIVVTLTDDSKIIFSKVSEEKGE